MRSLLSLCKLEFRATGDDLLLMVEVEVEHLLQVQYLRLAVYECEHYHTEGILKLGMLVELIQHDLGIYILAKFNSDAHSLS